MYTSEFEARVAVCVCVETARFFRFVRFIRRNVDKSNRLRAQKYDQFTPYHCVHGPSPVAYIWHTLLLLLQWYVHPLLFARVDV